LLAQKPPGHRRAGQDEQHHAQQPIRSRAVLHLRGRFCLSEQAEGRIQFQQREVKHAVLVLGSAIVCNCVLLTGIHTLTMRTAVIGSRRVEGPESRARTATASSYCLLISLSPYLLRSTSPRHTTGLSNGGRRHEHARGNLLSIHPVPATWEGRW
jgi:hypothetical protein